MPITKTSISTGEMLIRVDEKLNHVIENLDRMRADHDRRFTALEASKADRNELSRLAETVQQGTQERLANWTEWRKDIEDRLRSTERWRWYSIGALAAVQITLQVGLHFLPHK